MNRFRLTDSPLDLRIWTWSLATVLALLVITVASALRLSDMSQSLSALLQNSRKLDLLYKTDAVVADALAKSAKVAGGLEASDANSMLATDIAKWKTLSQEMTKLELDDREKTQKTEVDGMLASLEKALDTLAERVRAGDRNGAIAQYAVVETTAARLSALLNTVENQLETDKTNRVEQGRELARVATIQIAVLGAVLSVGALTITLLLVPGVMRKLHRAISQLAASVQQLVGTAQEQTSGATEQASAVAEVTASIEELSRTAQQIATTADQSARLSEQSAERAARGQAVVEQTIESIGDLRDLTLKVTERVQNLGDRSQRIGQIIDLIDSIADETHLLSLNAAIEAAGAAEHGRRFSVVANEVKRLAERSLKATEEVRSVIGELQSAINLLVISTEERIKPVLQVDKDAREMGELMHEFVERAQHSALASREISLATQQQRSASEQAVSSMRDVAEAARHVAVSSQQTLAAAHDLDQVVVQLKELV